MNTLAKPQTAVDIRTLPLRRLAAVALILHGLAHLVGLSEAVTAIGDDGQLEYLFGGVELDSTATMTISAVIWTGLAIGFVVAGILTWIDHSAWRIPVIAVSSLSMLLCLLALPRTWIGVVFNGAVIALTLASNRAGKIVAPHRESPPTTY